MDSVSPVATYVLIAGTVLLSIRGFSNPLFVERYLFSTRPIRQHGEWFRVVSSAFLHADWMHLGFNMFTLYFFAPWLELGLGVGSFLLIYFASIVGGGLLSYALHRHENYRALGASGGVSGVVFAQVFLFPGGTLYLFGGIPMPSWVYAILFVAGSIYGMQRRSDNIGHDAHLGGAIVGLLTATVLVPQIVAASPLLYVAVVGLTGGYLLLNSPVGRLLRRRMAGGSRRPRLSLYRPEDEDDGDDGDAAVLDLLLDKVSRVGMEGLTPEERELLDRLSRRRPGH